MDSRMNDLLLYWFNFGHWLGLECVLKTRKNVRLFEVLTVVGVEELLVVVQISVSSLGEHGQLGRRTHTLPLALHRRLAHVERVLVVAEYKLDLAGGLAFRTCPLLTTTVRRLRRHQIVVVLIFVFDDIVVVGLALEHEFEAELGLGPSLVAEQGLGERVVQTLVRAYGA